MIPTRQIQRLQNCTARLPRRDVWFAGVLVAVLAGLAPMWAWAANPVLGQLLDFEVTVRGEPGEVTNAECASAEVVFGERRVPAHAVRVQVEPTGVDRARIRVRSTLVVDEPVVSVRLTTGCNPRVARQFVLLTDLPVDPAAASGSGVPSGSAAAASEPQQAAPVATPPQALDPAAAPTRDAASARAPTGAAARPLPEGRSTAARRKEPRPATVRAAATRAPTRVANPAAARGAPEPAPRLMLEAAEPPSAVGVATPSAAESAVVEQALLAVAQAAEAARAAASAASAAAARIQSLESTVTQLQDDKQRQTAATAAMRSELASSQRESRWFKPLMWGSLALTVLSGAIGWHLGGVHRRRQLEWQRMAFERAGNSRHAEGDGPMAGQGRPSGFGRSAHDAGAASKFDRDAGVSAFAGAPARPQTTPAHARARDPGPVTLPAAAARGRSAAPAVVQDSAFGRATTAPIPLVTQEVPPATAVPAHPAPAARPLAERPSERPSERTEVLPPSLRLPEAEAAQSRDVSIEELIDLEQQAEFFIVLGQQDAAVDLLVEHLRETGGGSPLPYLKLLEIHRRRGEQAAYERTRSRFNQRFNAYAPEWGSDLNAGRALDAYPEVMPRLQQVWGKPLDAMAELEALLFRKSRGDLFELPAYREVLFLYALARDLLDREAVGSASVDLLLPITEGAEFSPTAPQPYLGLEGELGPNSGFGPDSGFRDLSDRPTAPVDFDISTAAPEGDRRTSIFDPFDDKPVTSRY